MSSHHSNESEGESIKSLLKQLASQSLSYRQMVKEKDEYNKSKKSSHASSSRVDNSFGKQSLRINEYYKPSLRKARKERKENPKEVRVELPHFHGKEDVETYLDWEMKVEQLFACNRVSEEKKVPLATLSFQSNAVYWWTALKTKRHLHKDPPITYWNDLRGALRCRHIPSHDNRKFMDKVQRLHQRNLSVEEYWQKMVLYIKRAWINEENHTTISRFLSGLKLEIRNKVELLPYRNLNDLIQLSIKVEKQILRKQSSQKQSSYSVFYDKDEFQRGKEHIEETSLKLFQNLSEHISHTQAREIQCLECLGKGHLASHCSNERSMILRNKYENSIQEKETSESEENDKKKERNRKAK